MVGLWGMAKRSEVQMQGGEGGKREKSGKGTRVAVKQQEKRKGGHSGRQSRAGCVNQAQSGTGDRYHRKVEKCAGYRDARNGYRKGDEGHAGAKQRAEKRKRGKQKKGGKEGQHTEIAARVN